MNGKNILVVIVVVSILAGLIYFLCWIFIPSNVNKKNSNKLRANEQTDSSFFMLTDSNGNISMFDPSNNTFKSKGIISTGNINSSGKISADGDIVSKGKIQATGSISSNQGISSDGNIIAGNSLYADNNNGSVRISGGLGDNRAGHINFYKKDGARKGYIGWGAGGANYDYIELNAENADGYMINDGKKFCIGEQCLSQDDIRRLKLFLQNIPKIKDNLLFLQQRGGKNDDSTMNGEYGNSIWAACLAPFFRELRTGFDI